MFSLVILALVGSFVACYSFIGNTGVKLSCRVQMRFLVGLYWWSFFFSMHRGGRAFVPFSRQCLGLSPSLSSGGVTGGSRGDVFSLLFTRGIQALRQGEGHYVVWTKYVFGAGIAVVVGEGWGVEGMFLVTTLILTDASNDGMYTVGRTIRRTSLSRLVPIGGAAGGASGGASGGGAATNDDSANDDVVDNVLGGIVNSTAFSRTSLYTGA